MARNEVLSSSWLLFSVVFHLVRSVRKSVLRLASGNQCKVADAVKETFFLVGPVYFLRNFNSEMGDPSHAVKVKALLMSRGRFRFQCTG